MKRVKTIWHKITTLSKKKKTALAAIVIGLVWFGYSTLAAKQATPQYQTQQATKDTLIVSVTSSGTVAASNNANVNTQASGVVTKLYVKNGDAVKSGDPIMEMDLDREAKQKYTQALASYQSASNSLAAAQANAYNLQSAMFSKWDKFLNLATNGTYQNGDGTPNNTNRTLPEFTTAQDDWLATEAQYKNQQNVIGQAQTAVSSSWLSLQQSSPTVYAPISGTVSGLALQVGSVLVSTSTNSSSNSTTTTNSSQKVASVVTQGSPLITLSLTEVDVPKVKIGNKVTVTLDALPGKTFAGTVVSIDTVGAVSSGVTSYPTTVQLDTDVAGIYSNMSASATIITQTKDDVLLIPIAALQTQNEQNYVRVLKNGVVSQVAVEKGLASDSQVEIVSGLKEGDVVVTSITSTATTTSTSQTASPFSALGGRGIGGGTVRTPGR
jgi:HlyD family secretion protein